MAENKAVAVEIAGKELEVGVAYMNVWRGVDPTHNLLEWSARADVGVAFVRQCWIDRSYEVGTQSHPNYMHMCSMSSALKVTGFMRKDLVACCRLFESALRFVYV